MIGLDTNVLVRYIAQDDTRQAARAREVIEQADGALFLSVVVLCELTWVLLGAYDAGKTGVVEVLETVLDVGAFEIEHRDAVRQALADYRTGRGDFADYVIGRLTQAALGSATVTFDRRLAGHPLFDVLGA